MADTAEGQETEAIQWRIAGGWCDLCNCAIGCPCVFGSDPTHGFCETVHGWLIRDGNYGDVPLSGLAVVTVIRFEGNVMEKNREFSFLIDDRANAEQRQALETIYTGKAGGAFAAWRDLTIQVDGVDFVPMNVSFTDKEWKVEVPGLVEAFGGPYRKHMVPEDDTCRIHNAPRPDTTPGHITVGQAVRNIVTGVFGRNWDHSGRSSKHIDFDLRGPEAYAWRKPLR